VSAPEDGPDPRPVSFLPGLIPDRTTWEGWDRWRRSRRAFEPAAKLGHAAYLRLSPRGRRLHDLHRLATHSNLAILSTPMSESVSWRLRTLIEANAFERGPDTRPGMMINGGGAQGKTETVCEVAAGFHDDWLALHSWEGGTYNPQALHLTRDLHAPVAYVRTPVKASPISTCKRILDFYGEDYRGMRLDDLVRTVEKAIYAHGTKALILDDVTRLKLHREADQDVLDLIRELMSLPVTLVLVGVGIPSSGLLRDGRKDPRTGRWIFPPVKDRGRSPNDQAAGQTDRRFDLLDLDPFGYDTPEQIAAWNAHLVGIEGQLRLFRGGEGMLTDGTMPEILFARTNGVVGLLKKLVQSACRAAMESGSECINEGLLADLEIVPADLDLDQGSGEVPNIPAAGPAGAGRKPRNTVFDDRGPRTATAN
jgi:hypothetical protein